MADPDDDDRAMRARLEKLSGALSARKAEPKGLADAASGASGANSGRAIGLGLRVMSEFVAGIIVGAFIGWQLDKWLGVSPLFLIVFLALGSAAGFRNVYRLAAGPTAPRDGGPKTN